ncbi:MAG: nickel pincer cofactor biosynthesis protein LarC [Myxococcota bacterium]
MKTLFWDLVGGAAGDMLMASLVDAGADPDKIRAAVDSVGLEGVELVVNDVRSAGLRAKQVDVMIHGRLADTGPGPWTPLMQPSSGIERGQDGHGHGGHRAYSAIREILEKSALPVRVKRDAQRTFRLLAESEADAHGVPLEDVMFHEVGADDAIVDIVGVAVALDDLGVERIVVSPVPLGRGIVRGAHGPIPLPGPATLHLLRDVPVLDCGLEGESVTPTGAALLRAHAGGFGTMPSMVLRTVGTGAGHKQWPDRPNVVRALVGESASVPVGHDEVLEVSANMDDMLPQHVPVLIDELLAAGAFDAWATPAQMKKGRQGSVVCALVRSTQSEAVKSAFFQHGSTLGVREVAVQRTLLARDVTAVETEFGSVRIKRAFRPNGLTIVPEHDDCVDAARRCRTSVRTVYEAAIRAASVARHPTPTSGRLAKEG